MGNIAPSVSFSFKVNFSRETPNDFYLSGDRVQGVIQVATDDTDNDLNSKYGPLYVELIGELNDFKASIQQHINRGVKIFFRKRAQLTKLPNDNQQLETNRLQIYKWAFDGLLESLLPSSLPPDDVCDPCICYYARAYLHRCPEWSQKCAFIVFTRTSIPVIARQSLQNNTIEASIRHKRLQLHGTISNNGLAVPGQSLMLQIEIDNPMQVTIKSIRATLKQYRNIIDEETNFTVFSSILPGFEQTEFNSKYRQSTYELSIPLEKCRVMAPTSSYKNVRYELHVQCHIHCLFNRHFTLKLPVICTTDHQQTLKIMDELKSLPGIIQHLSNKDEEKPPPSYEDFIASEVLPKYDDIIH